LETFEGLIRRLVESFNSSGLDYMLTGALAASYYGTPRTTTDVDIMVKVGRKDLKSKLAPALEMAGLEVDQKKIEAALRSGFRVVTFSDKESPFTVDIILSDRKLVKRPGTILGLSTFYQTPEELILSKLRMIRATIPRERALKDEDDIKAILKFTEVDIDALRKRAERDSTLPLLEALTANGDRQYSP